MAAGLPIVSSLPGELEELIGSERIGIQYPDSDREALARALTWLMTHDPERREMGRRAEQLFRRRFDAAIVYPRLVSHLEETVTRHRRSSS